MLSGRLSTEWGQVVGTVGRLEMFWGGKRWFGEG